MSLDQVSECAEFFEGRHRIVVLSPHPDDESLACATLLMRAFVGEGAHVVCLTDGSNSHPRSATWPPERLAALRRAELVQALSLLGGSADDLTWLGFKDAALSSVDPAIVAGNLVGIIEESGARHIFSPAVEDHHADHKATARIAEEIRKRRPEWSFYCYPVWCRWDDPDFTQNTSRHAPCFLSSDTLRASKRAAIQAHQSQLGQVVTDDQDGFVLPSALVEKFINEDEIFWRMP